MSAVGKLNFKKYPLGNGQKKKKRTIITVGKDYNFPKPGLSIQELFHRPRSRSSQHVIIVH